MPLAVTVEAGENFPDNEAVTLARLRKGAKPSVAITGTVSAVDMQDGAITGAKLADTTIPASKMGNAVTTGESGAGNKGVILASDGTDKFNELYAGKRNAFLIGSSTKTGEEWADEYLLKSKTLNTESTLEVTDQTANDFTLKVGDGKIVKSMLANDAVGSAALGNYSVVIDSFAPGGGASSAGGIAGENADFWGGIIAFNPEDESGSTGWHGKAEALQPDGKHQTLYSTSIGEELKFGYHPCVPRAFCIVQQTGGSYSWNGGGTDAASHFTFRKKSGIESISRTGQGTYTVKFEENLFAENDSVSCTGLGHNEEHRLVPLTGTNAYGNTDDVDANREITVKFWYEVGTTFTELRNARYFTLFFY